MGGTHARVVAAGVLRRLGPGGGALAAPLLERIGVLAAAAAEAGAAAEEGDAAPEAAGGAAAALGAALGALGPEAVLAALPLALEEARPTLALYSLCASPLPCGVQARWVWAPPRYQQAAAARAARG